MGIEHILSRKLGSLSGGVTESFVCYPLKEADVYFFDEPSSYLDIYERMRMVGIIQDLSSNGKEFWSLSTISPYLMFSAICFMWYMGESGVRNFHTSENHQNRYQRIFRGLSS